MEILYLMIPLGAVLVAVAAAALIWAVRDGQFDELDSVAQRMPDDETD